MNEIWVKKEGILSAGGISRVLLKKDIMKTVIKKAKIIMLVRRNTLMKLFLVLRVI